MSKNFPKQLTSNIGLFYVCLELSKLGWNVLLTSRNTKGVDLVIHSQEAKRTHTTQVKSLTGREAANASSLIADFIVICRKVLDCKPEIFILTKQEAATIIQVRTNKSGKQSQWLQYRNYEIFRDNNWDKMGSGWD